MWIRQHPGISLAHLFKTNGVNVVRNNRIWAGYSRTLFNSFLKNMKEKLRGNEVLVPETICSSAFNPIIQNGYTPVYYKITSHFKIDFDDVEKLVSKQCGLFMSINYFGFPQDNDKIIDFCNRHELLFIEDNAHGYGGTWRNREMGTIGDFAFTSPRKSLPMVNGAFASVNEAKVPGMIFQDVNRSTTRRQLLKQTAKYYINYNLEKKKTLNEILSYSEEPANKYYGYFVPDYIIKSIINKRQEIFQIWKDICEQLGLETIFHQLMIEEECVAVNPLNFVCYAKNLKERNLFLEWGIKNGVQVRTWPDLPEGAACREGALRRWDRLLVFPIDYTVPVRRYLQLKEKVCPR